jgi:myo-inositol-1(or 4)-monophosphatase
MDLDKVLQVAVTAAKAAGAYLLEQQSQVKVIEKKSLHDWLLEQDQISEKMIITKIKETFPDHSFIAEESGAHKAHQKYQWIIDPLDGSFNYQRGWPIFGVVIGFMIDGEVTVSVIFLPYFNELYTATDGQGAYLNGKKIRVSSVSDLEKSVIVMGDYSADGDSEKILLQLEDMSKMAKMISRVRMIGSAAADHALLASGRCDALIARASKPWDIYIGKKLVEEAGGKVSLFYNKDKGDIFIFSNNKLHKKLTAFIIS